MMLGASFGLGPFICPSYGDGDHANRIFLEAEVSRRRDRGPLDVSPHKIVDRVFPYAYLAINFKYVW